MDFEPPPWLIKLLKYDLKERCHVYSVCIDNYYCIDCQCNRLCHLCDYDHINHKTLLIFKYDGQSVVRASEVSKYVEISNILIENYKGDNVVFLEKKGNPLDSTCKECSSIYTHSAKFCSIACKFNIESRDIEDALSSNMELDNVEHEEYSSTINHIFSSEPEGMRELIPIPKQINIRGNLIKTSRDVVEELSFNDQHIIRGIPTSRLEGNLVQENRIKEQIIIGGNPRGYPTPSRLENMVEESPIIEEPLISNNQTLRPADMFKEPPITDTIVIRGSQTLRSEYVAEEPPINEEIIIRSNETRILENVIEESLSIRKILSSSNEAAKIGNVDEKSAMDEDTIIRGNLTPKLEDVVEESPMIIEGYQIPKLKVAVEECSSIKKILSSSNEAPRFGNVDEEQAIDEEMIIRRNHPPKIQDVVGMIIKIKETQRLKDAVEESPFIRQINVDEEPPIDEEMIITRNQTQKLEDVAKETPRLGMIVKEPPIDKKIIIRGNETPKLEDVIEESSSTEQMPTTNSGNQYPKLNDIDLNF
ncbi:hypothetical protein ZOSMA_154G00010 [Zostera marina]|uniref:PLATZ transcription factor family protein n=1 Tax=Zostera marina TaxID=29655 RepID=A0A0K9PVT2_ZOSMR|nr:hypothetical protein ZOSMA_154G00010 [Zostera marina]